MEQTSFCTDKCITKHSPTCRSRKRRAADPIKYVYQNLKDRAKQRPKEFTITLEEFRIWCYENDFVPGRGDSVDRIENAEGYHLYNIQKMSLLDNIKKYHNHDRWQSATEQLPF